MRKMRKYGLNNISDLVFKNPAVPDEEKNADPNVGSGDENADRGNWSSKKEYLLSMIGYAVGLGNVWRFPYLTYKHGGGAFLIPYVIMLSVAGLPLFFMESSFGQFCSQGPINVWKAVPIFQGVGITMMLVSTFVSIYYNVIIAYSIYYLFASFQYPLPWSDCSSRSDTNCNITAREHCNMTAYNGSLMAVNTSMMTDGNRSCLEEFSVSVLLQSPSERYWDVVALQRTSSMDETGPVVWHLALCLLLGWILIAAALFKGIKSSGKVVYFTATFPYAVLLILLIRGVTLEGARNGIEYYIGSQSNLTKLAEAEVWKDAATQIFFSLSIAWGGLTALASYNKFHNNCYKDSIIVCITNCSTSIFAGFAIFSILGHMAHVYGKPVSEVAQAGFGLAFIAYPDALSKLPISPLWSILFFFMLITLGLDSQFAGIEVITTCLQDAYPKFLKAKRGLITVLICIVLFLLGLPCVTGAGIYWVNLIDTFCAGWILLVAGLLEVFGLSCIYGGNRFIKDIEMMIGTKHALFWIWWRACWFFITPVVLLVILGWSLYTFTAPTYGSVEYPQWGIALGWCMTVFCLVWIPIVAVWKLVKASGNPWQRLKSACSPTEDWGPYLECHRNERYGRAGMNDTNVYVISNKNSTRL
ncbi:sodium- and chloride-dependent neutral and basic amino acid transporter B(0+) [Colossoma macropomum]|uniref:sodium- and chloride-dependent neutral and basic amino acid transporter B(0+) n=1 Tax=Colossoma macropomum TaxID=42526 RepID=UPI00186442E1|nr:sodium- and chloride-dependent neutral and basic amino acid transporter B(0+) [Colossoma macropomum]